MKKGKIRINTEIKEKKMEIELLLNDKIKLLEENRMLLLEKIDTLEKKNKSLNVKLEKLKMKHENKEYFGIIDLNNHWRNMISNLNSKLYSTSPMLKFWDCFLACMRIENGQCQLQLNNNIRESGGALYFNLNTIYPIIQKQWFPMFRTTAPSKNDVRRWIKEEDKLFVRDRVSMHINPNLKRTKVMEINMEYLPNKDEIMNEIHYQRYYFPNSGNTKDIDEEEEENKKIPF